VEREDFTSIRLATQVMMKACSDLREFMFLKTASASELASLGRTRSPIKPPQQVSESNSE
jgi:hypothetical protein